MNDDYEQEPCKEGSDKNHNDDSINNVNHNHHYEQEPCKEGSDICTHLITLGALLLTVATLPVSLILVIKVVQVGQG